MIERAGGSGFGDERANALRIGLEPFVEDAAKTLSRMTAHTREDIMALLVTSQTNQSVREFDASTGAFVKAAASGGALGDPLGVVVGLDGNVLVSDGQTNQVKRYDKTTGAFIDVFASTNLAGPMGMTIHQGALYVANVNSPQGVQRFDATTGVTTGQFVPSIGNAGPRDVKVNPANNRLCVLYYNVAAVEMFDLTTMAPLGLLLPQGTPFGSGGLFTPSSMVFGPDGNLYINGGTFGATGVRRYHPTTGAFIDLFATTGSNSVFPAGIAFGPDQHLYMATSADSVMRFDGSSGAFIDDFVPAGSGALDGPYHLTFGPTAGSPALDYTLRKQCLDDIPDIAGYWQIEGGMVFEGTTHVGFYSVVRRVSCGTKELNTSQVWMTLFFLGGKPPENITLHGANDFVSTNEMGSVSAASPAFASHIGKTYKRSGNSLTIL